MAVKDNQPKLYDALKVQFLAVYENEQFNCLCLNTKEKGRGRLEDRMYCIMPIPKSIVQQHPEWKGLKSIGQLINITRRDVKETSDVRCYISSLPAKADKLSAAV